MAHLRTPRSPRPRSRDHPGWGRVRRVVAVLVMVAVVVGAAVGCAGRKGRNDDDPGPHEYSIRLPVHRTIATGG